MVYLYGQKLQEVVKMYHSNKYYKTCSLVNILLILLLWLGVTYLTQLFFKSIVVIIGISILFFFICGYIVHKFLSLYVNNIFCSSKENKIK